MIKIHTIIMVLYDTKICWACKYLVFLIKIKNTLNFTNQFSASSKVLPTQ